MKFEHLLTEARHPDTARIDQLSTREMLEVINTADRSVADAVHAEIARIAQAVDGIAERLEQGGRLFYIGAGTSGRLGVLDASECPPTFNVDPRLVVGLIAGGDHALRHSIEGAGPALPSRRTRPCRRGSRWPCPGRPGSRCG